MPPVKQTEVGIRPTVTRELDRICLPPLAMSVTERTLRGPPQKIPHSTMLSAGDATKRGITPVVAQIPIEYLPLQVTLGPYLLGLIHIFSYELSLIGTFFRWAPGDNCIGPG